MPAASPPSPQEPPPPQVRPRPGPRPLPLHLATANLILLSSLGAWPSAKLGLPPWNPEQNPLHADLLKSLQSLPPEVFAAALAQEAGERLSRLALGIGAYRDHTYRRDLPDPPLLWAEGTTRLLDYGQPGQPALLLAPSLVNRHYVLDLGPGQSLVRYLAGRGLRPLLLDWAAPGETEHGFDLTAYITRLGRALASARQANGGRPLPLLGYCMGGNLALAAALRQQEDVSALALLATPWDFHAGGAHQAELVQQLAPQLAPAPGLNGAAPEPLAVDVLQGFFWALDPLTALKKFSSFTRIDPGSDAARRFVAMEDWLNDGIPLAGNVARECLNGWYGANTPARGEWRVGGEAVLPGLWRKPALVVLPERDKLVPKEAAEALFHALPGAWRHDAPSGHIGMVVGPRAEAGLWQPLAEWIAGQG